MIRLGLCCLFREAPIRFATTTAKYAGALDTPVRIRKLAGLCLGNADALREAILFCAGSGIGAFRVNSRILPLITHPDLGYRVPALPEGGEIIRRFQECGALAARHAIRLSFHPDQFTLLSSPDPEITRKSVAELAYQAEVAEWIGADVINIHGGGAYGDKETALKRVVRNIKALDTSIRKRLTLENDDRVYTPIDLLPLCLESGVPLVYDLHHHRCLPDCLSPGEVTQIAMDTWDREPLFHISSPKHGWLGAQPQRHHDFIDIDDFPDCWRSLKTDITVDVEAKAKEIAVLKLRGELAG
jgi:UV DNA damage endonuclease